MALVQFLQALFDTGRVQLDDALPPSEGELLEANRYLRAFEELWRQDLAKNAPPISEQAAQWAAVSFFQASQFLMFRDLPAQAMSARLSTTCPDEVNSPSQVYSVDLVFRFLPDLFTFSHNVSALDPLSHQIRKWCIEWPLSSVGVRELDAAMSIEQDCGDDNSGEPMSGIHQSAKPNEAIEFHIDRFANNPCLMQLYVDRILATGDRTRTTDSRVANYLRLSLGGYPELAGRLSDICVAEKQNPVED